MLVQNASALCKRLLGDSAPYKDLLPLSMHMKIDGGVVFKLLTLLPMLVFVVRG